jgi:hypothetical protein
MLLFHYCLYALYSFCEYRMQFCRGEMKDLPRPKGIPLLIALKVSSLLA